MPARKHSRETIVRVLQNLAKDLGKDTLAKRDVGTHLAPSSINYYFGSLGNALVAAGLKRTDSSAHLRNRDVVITDEDLFRSLHEVEMEPGHEPGRWSTWERQQGKSPNQAKQNLPHVPSPLEMRHCIAIPRQGTFPAY